MNNHIRNVLIVDDQSLFRIMIASILKKAGLNANLMQAEDGMQGVQKLDLCQYDLIITDLNMPNLDGIGFIKEIRQHPVNKFVKICVLSGTEDKLCESVAKKSGANAFVAKPIEKQPFLETVRRLLK